MSNYVPGQGNDQAKLMLIGESPGKDEDESGIPFVGKSGELLWDICKEVGFSREETWTTNVYKYRPPLNQIKRIKEVCDPEEQIEKLWAEIRSINPACIIAIGATAFETITGLKGILKWRGSVVKSKDGAFKVIGTIHTSNLVRASWAEGGERKLYPYIWKWIIKSDIEKAWRYSQDSYLRVPSPDIRIARGCSDFQSFLSRNSHKEKVANDIESYNCIPVCEAFAFDRYEAMVVPLFNRIGPLNVSGITAADQAYLWYLIDRVYKEKKIIGQNYKYDQDKKEMLGFKYQPRGIWSDTLLKANVINPELPSKKMESLQSLWTDLPYHKDEGKEFSFGKGKIEKLFHYNGLDAVSTFWTDDSMESDLESLGLVSYFYDFIMELPQAYLDMERVGFLPDLEAREFLKHKYQTRHDLVQARLADLIGEGFEFRNVKSKKKAKICHEGHVINVAHHAQIKGLIYTFLKCPPRYGRGKDRGKLSSSEDTLVGLMNNVLKDDRRKQILGSIIEDRRVRKTLGTYILAKPDYDGRIRGTYRILGTETSRSSTAILSPPLRPVKSGHAFQTLTKHGDIGSDIRTIYKVDKGFVFIQIDLSQAEPRIVAVLSRDWELIKAFQSGKVDIHRRTAALVLGYSQTLNLEEEFDPIADILGKESGERFLGKKCRNGGNYNMGKGELMLNVNSDAKRFNIDVKVSEWKAGKMLDAFHVGSPLIREVFHAEVINAIDTTRTLVDPHGGRRTFFGRLENETYKEGFAHLPQKTVALQVKKAILSSRKEMPDFKNMLMGEAHDALLMRFPIGEAKDRAKVVKGFMERPIDFRGCSLSRDFDLSIPADVEIGTDNYRDMEKLKI
jgi:uracil-DNA glycosylase family 4